VTVSRLLHLAAYALALGILLGWGLAWIEMRPFADVRDVRWPLLAEGMRLGSALTVLAVAVWAAVYLLARRWGRGVAARAAAVLVLVPLLIWFEGRDQVGGGRVSTATFVLGGLVGAELLARGLRYAMEERVRAARAGGAAALLAAVPVVTHAVAYTGRGNAPDVLFILLDVARADHLGCYGYERDTSPNLDRLAADSILLENAISSSTFTKTSISTLFTSLNAHHHGVFLGTFGKDPNTVESDTLGGHFTTLAEAMYGAGRNTVAWVQNGQLRGFMGFDQGFSLYHDQPGLADAITGGFLDWRARWGDHTPYFAYLHYIDLHAPYHPPPPFQGKFGSKKGDLSDQMSDASWYDFKVSVAKGAVVLSQEDLDGFESRYDELIAHLDSWIGRIIDELKASGRYDDTLIVVTSDHGEGFWEHGFISHSTTPYEELVHVPLIMKMPQSAGAGRRIERMVGTIDLMPTLLDFVGAWIPDNLEGRSFLPLLEGTEEALDPGWLTLEFRSTIAVRTERWKLIRVPGRPPELYDLDADPAEANNCIDDNPDLAKRLGQAVRRSLEIRKDAKAAERVVLDADTVEALEALGYL
jgi:arylsulfatase A-like enzyme